MSQVDSEIHGARSETRRALFVELLGGIGDLIFALPALDALTRDQSQVRWDVLTFAPGAELLSADPRVDQVFTARKGGPDFVKGAGPDSRHPYCWHDLAELLRARRYELIITDTRHSGIPDLIEASGAPWTITQLWRGAGPEEPIARLFLRRLREEAAIDRDRPDPPAFVFLTPAEEARAQHLWDRLDTPRGRAVVLHPHAGMVIKRWPSESFVDLGRGLRSEGCPVAVLMGEDSALARKIADLAGATLLPLQSLRETAACLAGVGLLVSSDTGLAHLASAVGAPVLGIYGPTWAGRYGVPSPGRSLRSSFVCPERKPMDFTLQRCWYTGRCVWAEKLNCCEDVTVESVLAVAREILQQHQPSGRREARLPILPSGGIEVGAARSLAPSQWRRRA